MGIVMTIDILRGRMTQWVEDKGYNQLPTFGVGKDITEKDWHDYLCRCFNLVLWRLRMMSINI